MNTGSFAGYVGRHPDLRTTPSGSDVLNFSLGVSVGFGDRASTLWVACHLWGERARKLQPFITTGKAIAVSGDVTVRAYQSKQGEPKAELELNVQRLTLLGGRDAGDEEGLEAHAEQPKAAAKPEQRDAFSGTKPESSPVFDDDIPF